MSIQGTANKVEFKAKLDGILTTLANAFKIVKAVQGLPSGARLRFPDNTMIGRRDAEGMYNASLSMLKTFVTRSHTAAGKAKRKVGAKGTSVGFIIPFTVGAELRNYINQVYSTAAYKPIRDALHYFKPPVPVSGAVANVDYGLGQIIANQNVLTNLLIVIVKMANFPKYSAHNAGKPETQWNKQWLGADQAMATGLQQTFATLVTEGQSEFQIKKRKDKVDKFRKEFNTKIAGNNSITDPAKKAAANQKLQLSYETKINDANKPFSSGDFRYSGLQSIISKNRTPLVGEEVATNAQLKQLSEVIMPSSLTKQQRESREQDLIEGSLVPSILIGQAFQAAQRTPDQNEITVTFLFDDLYILKRSIQQLKAQEENPGVPPDEAQNRLQAKIRAKIAKILT